MSKILNPFKKVQSKEAIDASEKAASEELQAFLDDLCKRHDVHVVPTVIFGASMLGGIKPVSHKIECVSTKRFTE